MGYLFNYYDIPNDEEPNFCNFCGKEAPENKMYCSSSCLVDDSEL